MKLRSKVLLLSSLLLITMMAAIVATVTHSVLKSAERDIVLSREHEVDLLKAEIKDTVNMAYQLVASKYNEFDSEYAIKQHHGKRAKNVIESAQSLLEQYQQRVASGEMTLADAQREAKNRIRKMRYDDNQGYIWINDTQLPFPTMVMHPIMPDLEGEMLNDKKWNTAKGVTHNLFAAAVRLTTRDGGGYIQYEWNKPKDTSDSKKYQKISYVSQFKPWGWVLGTGIYFDELRTDNIERLKESIGAMRYADGEGYFYILSDELPFPKSIMQPIAPQFNGKVMDSPKWNKIANNGTEHLFTALVKATRNADGAGYVNYVLKKPTKDGSTVKAPKISYERVFKPLNWIIGSGLYVDEINERVEVREAEKRRETRELIQKILIIAGLVLVVSLIAVYFFARGLSKGIEELTAITHDISLGKGLDTQIASTKRQDEIGQLAQAIERLQTSVNMMINRMKKKS